ncbi:GDYXXLXY domain-containing protein [Manganibacter manganicus]|uniref:GDYXXLXY domain-containing protein n=1 Tax=Manganibacter manganicus TaxID=1873176 RepID=A0A1V8RUH2_9HYPH|nr:GDYXXLXY domain-containing protein [Pseudaminobacter manganicus]OQM76793.1 hypothetical protein BFN67_12870 [Pseudaminobacter manganicus]
MTRGARLILAATAVALLQVGFLGWIIAGRAAILRNGTEVLLQVKPIDPRDLLRGDYVALGYDISDLPVSLIANLAAGSTYIGEGPVTVRLKKSDAGYWHAVSAWLGKAPHAAPDGEADIAGNVLGGSNTEPGSTVRVDYGIGRFYVPEGEGLAIQNDIRVRPFGIRVALAQDGRAQIKALVDGDRTLFEEPLY